MKRLLPFTLFCCFCISSMHAVQEQNINNRTLEKTEVKEPTIKKPRTSKAIVLVTKKVQAITLRKMHGAFGHAIKKISHREIIDKHKRIASNN